MRNRSTVASSRLSVSAIVRHKEELHVGKFLKSKSCNEETIDVQINFHVIGLVVISAGL